MTQPHRKDEVLRMAEATRAVGRVLLREHKTYAEDLDTLVEAAAMLRAYAEVAEDAACYRWLRNRAVLFQYPDGSKGSPYVCYDLGLGDTNPTWGTELDSMLLEAMTADAALVEQEVAP